MNRSSTLTMGGVLLNDLADQAIVVEVLAAEQSGEFYLAVFGDFMSAADTRGSTHTFSARFRPFSISCN